MMIKKVLVVLVLVLGSVTTSKIASPRYKKLRSVASGGNSTQRLSLPNGRAVTLWGLRTRCPMAFYEVGGRCYFYSDFRLNWFRSMEFCHSFGKGVSLAVVETAKENHNIKHFLRVHGDKHNGVWLGGSDNGHNGRWAWFPTGKLIGYTNWGPSQPSGGDQHCMYLVGGHLGYQWADFHCLYEMNFLCEYKVNEDVPW